ncbi:MAG: septum site-determining protein MinC [Oceanicoccus sp.]|jgi:septum site-determining protein MinC
MSVSNSSSAESESDKASFRLKGGLYPFTLLDVHHYDRDRFEDDLQSKVAEAPAFFQQTPVILGFESFAGDFRDLRLSQIQEMLRDSGMIAVAVKGASASLEVQAAEIGLAIMSGKSRPPKNTDTAVERASEPAVAVVENIQVPVAPVSVKSKVISTPIRSGQQVYAPGGDLIVLAPVSAGAEILADGNIHVYAPLRGRALAGVQGDESAQVFCQSLEAELISIAGHFKLVEDLKNEHWKQAVRISLQAQALCINPLANAGR